jgi:hypothetical protein
LPDPPPPEKLATTVGRPLINALKWHQRAAPVIALGPICRRLEDYRAAALALALRLRSMVGSVAQEK